MHYSKDYYTKAKARIDKLQKENIGRNIPSKESDCPQGASQSKQGIEQILARIRKMQEETMPVINLNKLANFFHLMGRAEELAEYCEMNIDIKTTGSLFGVLKLRSEYIMMNQDTDIRIREILNELTLKSEQFSIAALEDTFEMEYWFKLFDIVEKEE